MSTLRRASARVRKDHEGRVVCSCGCGRYPAPPRQTWFSEECVHEWRIKNQPAYVRAELLKRDQGICAICGVDCLRLERRRRAANQVSNRHIDPGKYRHRLKFDRAAFKRAEAILEKWRPRLKAAAKARRAALAARGFTSGRDTLWDADHIVPVVEGGGQCGLSNYRTLCHPCHKAVTAELAARRAAAKKDFTQMEMTLP